MAYEDKGLSHPRSDRVTNEEHEVSATAKRVLIVGQEGEELLSLIDGKLKVHQTEDMTGLLTAMVKEMKITNMHLAILTDNVITKQEIE